MRTDRKNMYSADVSQVMLTLTLNRYPCVGHVQGRYVKGRCGGDYCGHHPRPSKPMQGCFPLNGHSSPQATQIRPWPVIRSLAHSVYGNGQP